MSTVGQTRKAYRILVVKHVRRCVLWKRKRWKCNIEKGLKEAGFEDGRWIELAQGCVQGRIYYSQF
jgi:hypothetical protein